MCSLVANQMSFGNNQDLLIIENKNLKNLLLLNLDLIQSQEETIVAKNKKIQSLQDENKALKLRLERIERRMVLIKPKGINYKNYEWKIQNTKKKLTLNTNGSIPTKIYPKTIRLRNTPKSKVKTQPTKSKINTTLIKSTLDNQSKTRIKSYSKIFQTDLLYHINNHFEDIGIGQSLSNDNVEVPSWRSKHTTALYVMEGTENLDNHVFDKRHQRFELEEKKRKKWDGQRMRDLDLLRKCRDKNTTQTTIFDVVTFAPQPNQAKVIEIVEKLPVSAFTEPLPILSQSQFFLPWLEPSKCR